MKPVIFLFLVCFTTMLSAQSETECDQITIKFHGLLTSNKSDQLFFEVSNQVYTGNLYYYPGFLLLNEEGDTIAKEAVKYYGIGTGFQTHILELQADIAFPFSGYLELHGSYYQKRFCSFPVEIESADYVSFDAIKSQPVKVELNMAENFLVLDLGGSNINAEVLDYHYNVTNELGEVVYKSTINLSATSIPIEELGGPGIYYISVWDGVQKELLPTMSIEVE